VLLPVELANQSRGAYRERAQELLDMVGVGEFAARYPRQLSGGMQQRVSLARALIRHASVLLMDEPFSALDAITREQMQMELLRIWRHQQATAVFITHDIPEAVFLADRVILMTPRPGRIREIFEVPLPRPRTLEHRFSEPFTALAREIRLAMLDQPEADVGGIV
jgi:NitT/TauT family transport system ATP-binding protein